MASSLLLSSSSRCSRISFKTSDRFLFFGESVQARVVAKGMREKKKSKDYNPCPRITSSSSSPATSSPAHPPPR